MAEEALNQEQDQQNVDTQETETERSFAIPSILEAVADESEEEESGDDDQEESEEESGEEQEQAADGDQQEEEESSDEDVAEAKAWLEEHVRDPANAPDWLKEAKIGIKVNGQPAEATFQDLVNSYQTQEAATQRLTEAKSKAQSLHQEATQKLETVTTELATASALAKLVEESVLKGELEQLNQLKTEHGAGSDEYQAAREALATKAQTLARAKQEISQKLSAALEQRNAQPSDEDYAEAQTKLFELHPELKEDENRTKLVQFAIGLGFTEEQLQTETNPLLFSLAWRALQHDETKAKANAAKKKVTTIPRMMKPSAQQPAQRNQKWDPGEALYGTS